MEFFTSYAPAKLNLFLHVKEKLPNNYHSIQSFIIFLDLYDIISIRKNDTIQLYINGNTGKILKKTSTTQQNILLKVTKYIKQEFNITENIYIRLEKNIPVGAGLGGGSSNAAILLKMLNTYWSLNLKSHELNNIALKFGADILSCLYSKSGILEGIGEKFTSIPLTFKLPILLVNNIKPLTTQQVYTNNKVYNLKQITIPLKINKKDDFLNFLKQQTNDLTEASIKLLPEIRVILNRLEETKPILARMTGSGSTCFAIYSSNKALCKAFNKLKQLFPNYIIKKVTNLI